MNIFDGQRALQHVEALVALGNRAPGTAGHHAAQSYIQAQLGVAGRHSTLQPFRAGPLLHQADLFNILSPGSIARDTVVVLGTHYDTIRLKKGTFVGANDGGSGVAVLLELARVLDPGLSVELVFFDGEEALGGEVVGLHGSRYYVRHQGHAVASAIIVDMVGDVNMRLCHEQLSTPVLLERLQSVGQALGYGALLDGPDLMVEDDHVAFLDAGLPAALLVDFGDGQGPGQPPYWHTVQDSLDKVCASSLEAVGRLLQRHLVTDR